VPFGEADGRLPQTAAEDFSYLTLWQEGCGGSKYVRKFISRRLRGELIILYERDRRLVLATFDPGSLAKHREQEIDVPQLK